MRENIIFQIMPLRTALMADAVGFWRDSGLENPAVKHPAKVAIRVQLNIVNSRGLAFNQGASGRQCTSRFNPNAYCDYKASQYLHTPGASSSRAICQMPIIHPAPPRIEH